MKVVILSKNPQNAVACVGSVHVREPELPLKNIIVVDDGARNRQTEAVLNGITWVAGQKPFIFSRNANLGILAAEDDDVILLNDDAILHTPCGFTSLVQNKADYGLVSPLVMGLVGNDNQKFLYPNYQHLMKPEAEMLCFVCVLIPRSTFNLVGPLDERFTGYGYEDNDYCRRVRGAGLKLGVWTGCTIDHKRLHSTFRASNPDLSEMVKQGLKIYCDKWGL